jgi:hypothetical protein
MEKVYIRLKSARRAAAATEVRGNKPKHTQKFP